MDVDRRRYSRQIRLSEIGIDGQTTLCAARVALVGDGFARTIEERYLRRAGVQTVDDRRTVAPDDATSLTSLGLRHAAAREVGAGALRALAGIRSALGTRR